MSSLFLQNTLKALNPKPLNSFTVHRRQQGFTQNPKPKTLKTPKPPFLSGCIDVFLIQNIGRAALAALFLKVAAKIHMDDENFIYCKAKSVEVLLPPSPLNPKP